MTDKTSQSTLPPVAVLESDLRSGHVWLHVDYFKTSGKWGYGYYARVPLAELDPVKFEGKEEFMRVVDFYQSEVVMGCWREYTVVLDDSHYNEIAEYKHFFKWLYHAG